jgi:hypothetical protein
MPKRLDDEPAVVDRTRARPVDAGDEPVDERRAVAVSVLGREQLNCREVGAVPTRVASKQR